LVGNVKKLDDFLSTLNNTETLCGVFAQVFAIFAQKNAGMKSRKSSKEKTSRLFNRYVWLVEIVYRYGRISFEDINKLWRKSPLNENEEDMPLRTFHDHRAAIEEMFDVNIDCDKSNGYKYYIDNSDDLRKDDIREWMLNSFTVNNLMNENRKLRPRILLGQVPSGQPYLTQIIEAMRDEQRLEITYQRFQCDEQYCFEIEPYCVKIFRQRWYVVARSPSIDAVRIYSFDRIKSLRTAEQSFKIPESFHPDAFFEHAFGIYVDEKNNPCTVQLRVFGDRRKYLQTLPLHHSQEETEINENDSVFSYFLCPSSDFKQEILSYGAEMEVLSPDWFRREVKESVKNMNNLYK